MHQKWGGLSRRYPIRNSAGIALWDVMLARHYNGQGILIECPARCNVAPYDTLMRFVMTKTKEASLDIQAQVYWAGRKANGAEGLALLHACIERCAKHRDWDALSRFLVKAREHGQGTRVATIIRAAFGDKLTFKANSKHPTGGIFTLGWAADKPFPLRESNTYGAVREAVQKGMSWDDKELQKILPKPIKKERQATPEQKQKVVKHLKAYTDKLKSDGFNVGEILAMLQKELASSVLMGGVQVNGEPNH